MKDRYIITIIIIMILILIFLGYKFLFLNENSPIVVSYYSQNKSLTVIERCDIMEWVMKNEPIPDKQ